MFQLFDTLIKGSTTAVIGTFLTTLVSAKLILYLLRRRKFPPGPYGLPLVGYLPWFGSHPHKTFIKLREKYGDIFSIQMGSFPAVVINGRDLIQEAFVNKGDEFSGRPNFFVNRFKKEKMTFGHFDERTILHKKIFHHCLYNFTSARKTPIEEVIYDETKETLSEFFNMDGKPFHPRDFLYKCVGSVVFQVCYGKHTNLREDNETFGAFLDSTYEFTKFVGSKNEVNVMPWLRFFLPGRFSKYVNLEENVLMIREKKVKECLSTYSPTTMRHLADGVIAAAKDAESDPTSLLTPERIYSTLDDIVGAGFETVATSLNWVCILLAAHPDVQDKVHKEIDKVLGKRQPLLTDRASMPYCVATINEVSRYANIAPLGLPHAAVKDAELHGYSIPKGTVILANWYSVSHDEKVWGDPMTFKPERYLDENGQIDQTVLNLFTPFAVGRRKCVGENLARTELFLMFTCIFQNCKLIKPDDVEEYSMESEFGLTLSPIPYKICALMR